MTGLYKLLLVDDETEMRRAIINKLDWDLLGFVVVGEASNGEEALELLDQLTPDVMMTDIRMPFMDGLTLCRRARQVAPELKTAILSGYDDFEYAKEAIRLEVTEYILKPIDAEELARVFTRLKQTLDTERGQLLDTERLYTHHEASLPMVRQQLLADIMNGLVPPQRIDAELRECGLELAADCYYAAVLCYDKNEGYTEPQLITYALQEVVIELLPKQLEYTILQMTDRLVLLFMVDEERQQAERREAMAQLDRLFTMSRKFLGLHLAIGVGCCATRRQDIPRSYREALEAVEVQGRGGAGYSVFYGDIAPAPLIAEIAEAQYLRAIIHEVKVGSAEDLIRAFEPVHRHFTADGAGGAEAFRLALGAALVRLLDRCPAGQEAGALRGALAGAAPQGGASEQLRAIQGQSEQLRALLRAHHKAGGAALAQRARTYISEHLADSALTLEAVSEALNVTPAHLAARFKRETGASFAAALTAMRLQKAVQLLESTGQKTLQIAEQVGYADPNYFSYLFKKQYGVAPAQYRNGGEKGSGDGLDQTTD